MAKEWCATAGAANSAAATPTRPKSFQGIIRSMKLTSQEYHECGRSEIRFLSRYAGATARIDPQTATGLGSAAGAGHEHDQGRPTCAICLRDRCAPALRWPFS